MKLLAHAKAGYRIRGIDRGLSAGDVVHVGKTVELVSLDTPGHTMLHVCLFSNTDTPALFSGDTIFAAGARQLRWRWRSRSDFLAPFKSPASQIACKRAVLSWSRLLCQQPGLHRRSRARQPTSSAMLQEVKRSYDADEPLVTTLGLEREINTFFRLTSRTVIHRFATRSRRCPTSRHPKKFF